jgi:glycerophosphoryl diester phosphodiesterase
VVQAPLIIAHRTAPAFAPENSLEGMRIAFEQGADGVEIDLRMTLDQRTYLMHDNSMARTTGWALPLELTPSFWARTRRLQSGHEAVPSLKQALDALPQDRLVAVDVKTPWAILPLAAAVRKRRIAGRTLVWCSSALVVQYAVRRNLGWEVAHYKDFEDSRNNRAFIETARRIGAQAVSLDWRAIDTELVAFAHERGLSVYSWHKDYELAESKLTAGLDGIITDYPARAREAVTEALGTR